MQSVIWDAMLSLGKHLPTFQRIAMPSLLGSISSRRKAVKEKLCYVDVYMIGAGRGWTQRVANQYGW